ncbi:helix-turn-helix domain-containing protein [Labilibaculum euxinus]
MESSIIERVKEIRNKNKVSQIEFANSLGVSASYIAGLEMGRNSLNQKFIFAVKEKYNISADWLLFGIKSSKPEDFIFLYEAVYPMAQSAFFQSRKIVEAINQKVVSYVTSDEFDNVECFMYPSFLEDYKEIKRISEKANDFFRHLMIHTAEAFINTTKTTEEKGTLLKKALKDVTIATVELNVLLSKLIDVELENAIPSIVSESLNKKHPIVKGHYIPMKDI